MKICIYCNSQHGQVEELTSWPCKICGKINFNTIEQSQPKQINHWEIDSIIEYETVNDEYKLIDEDKE